MNCPKCRRKLFYSKGLEIYDCATCRITWNINIEKDWSKRK